VNDRGGSGTSCGGIKVRTYTVMLSEKVRCLSKMKPRLRAECGVLSEELCILSGCFLSPMGIEMQEISSHSGKGKRVLQGVVYMMKSRGPRTEPFRTPQEEMYKDEEVLLDHIARTTYVDAVCWCRPSSMVCRSVTLTSFAKNG